MGIEGRSPFPFPFHIFLPLPLLLTFLHLPCKLLEYRGGNSSHSHQLGFEANAILLVPRLAVVPLNPRVGQNGRLRLGSRLLDLYKLPYPWYILRQIFSYSQPTGKVIQSDPPGMPSPPGQGLNIDWCITMELMQATNKTSGVRHTQSPRGGGVLPYITYTGMCRPKGS